MFTFKQLQEEQKPWVLHNFGDRPSWMPLVGIYEEYGEYLEAKTADERKDAIADVVIFISDYVSARGWSLENLWNDSLEITGWKSVTVILGRLAHAHLKQEQNIRLNENHEQKAKDAVKELLAAMRELALVHNIQLLDLVEQTWAKVKQRDWKASPAHA